MYDQPFRVKYKDHPNNKYVATVSQSHLMIHYCLYQLPSYKYNIVSTLSLSCRSFFPFSLRKDQCLQPLLISHYHLYIAHQT
ncbi:unnamed protein product [Malus baccata var. baccata]